MASGHPAKVARASGLIIQADFAPMKLKLVSKEDDQCQRIGNYEGRLDRAEFKEKHISRFTAISHSCHSRVEIQSGRWDKCQ
jgi:hypothetical protein